MSAPETFNLKIEFPLVRVTAQIYGDEEDVEIISAIVFPDTDCEQAIKIPRRLLFQARADWLAAKRERDAEHDSERQASAAETRANKGHLFGG